MSIYLVFSTRSYNNFNLCKSDKKGQARVAVLFSGGIDSTVLTFFAHRSVHLHLSMRTIEDADYGLRHIPIDEPIDLLNVAFENPRKIQIQAEGNIASLPKKQKKAKMRQMVNTVSRTTQNNNSYQVPDRVTGLEEAEELRRLCPGRVWNFVSCQFTRDCHVFGCYVLTSSTKVEVDVPYEVGGNSSSLLTLTQ